MEFDRLYIIGNGFDLHYDVRSSYADYLEYLLKRDERLHDLFLNLFPASIWKQFEEDLGRLEPGSLNANLFGLIEYDEDSDYAWEQESSALHYHYQAMEKELNVNKINQTFKDWAEQIDISKVRTDEVIRDTGSTLYLTFNYTKTLEKCFGIDEDRILHIHGVVGNPKLVIGHEPIEDKRILPPQHFHEQDMLEELRARFTDRTVKPVPSIIAANSDWFNSLKDVDEVIVAGFSFSDVDLPYIQQVKPSIKPCAAWKVFVSAKMSASTA